MEKITQLNDTLLNIRVNKKILANNIVILESKEYKGHFEYEFTLSNHYLKLSQIEKDFELVIDGYKFTDLKEYQLDKQSHTLTDTVVKGSDPYKLKDYSESKKKKHDPKKESIKPTSKGFSNTDNFNSEPVSGSSKKSAYDPYVVNERILNKYMKPEDMKSKPKPKKAAARPPEEMDEWDQFNIAEEPPVVSQPKPRQEKKAEKSKKSTKQNLDDSWEKAMNAENENDPDKYSTYTKPQASSNAYNFSEMQNTLTTSKAAPVGSSNDYNFDNYDGFGDDTFDQPKSLGLNQIVNKKVQKQASNSDDFFGTQTNVYSGTTSAQKESAVTTGLDDLDFFGSGSITYTQPAGKLLVKI